MSRILRSKTSAQTTQLAGISTYLPHGAWLLPYTSMNRAVWYRKVRRMRHDATIAFLRDVYMSPILASEWSVEVDDPKYQDAVPGIEKSFLSRRRKFLRDALRGLLDYGWQSYEVVKKQLDDGTLEVTKLKPLLQDITEIVVDEHGELLGVLNQPIWTRQYHVPIRLYRGDCVVLYRDAEGTNWYGEPIMKRAEVAYDSWNESDAAARRFDNKVAGSFLIIYYPKGTTELNGVDTPNSEIAKELARTAHSSGTMTIPIEVARFVDDLNNVAGSDKGMWRVELTSPQTQQSAFVDRAKYIDSNKCRAFGVPERAVTEGQYGTKAEAGEHADFAIDNIEMAHGDIVDLLNVQGVDPLLEVNHGEKYVGHVKIKQAPLTDDLKALLKQVYMSQLGNETGQAVENDKLDWDAIRKRLGLPVRDHIQGKSTLVTAPREQETRNGQANGRAPGTAGRGRPFNGAVATRGGRPV